MMGGKIYPALAFAKQVEGWSQGICSKVNRWHETESSSPCQFMTFRQCRAWLSDWLKHNPAPGTPGDSASAPHRRLRPHVRKAHW